MSTRARSPHRVPTRRPDVAYTVFPATGTVLVAIPGLRIISEANNRDQWWVKAERAREQRTTTYYGLRSMLTTPERLPLPLTIHLTRIGVQLLDAHDALPASFKAITDGICDFLFQCLYQGHKYDNDPRLTWQYAQRKHTTKAEPRYGVEIRFTRTA